MGKRYPPADPQKQDTSVYAERLTFEDMPSRHGPPSDTEAAFYRAVNGDHVVIELEGDADGKMLVRHYEGDFMDEVPVSDVTLAINLDRAQAAALHAFLGRFLATARAQEPVL